MEETGKGLGQTFQARIKPKESRLSAFLALLFIFSALSLAGLFEAFYPETMGKYTNYHPTLIQLSQALFALAGVSTLLALVALIDARAIRRTRGEMLTEVASRDNFERLSMLDAATGLFGRRYLDEIIPREVARAERRETGLSFVKLRMEEFDAASDRLGIETIEKIVKEAAQLLKNCFRPTDIVIRTDRAEFLIILPDTAKHSALIAVRRLLTKVDEWNARKPIAGFQMDLSVGVSDHTKGKDVRDALAAADTHVQLYRDQQAPKS